MSINDLLDRWDDALVNMPVVDVEGVFIGSVSKVVLSELSQGFRNRKQVDDAAIKAGNALGELYLIGLSGLLGSHSESDNTN
jgi:Glu-tRNA(Gln) amidotransferase subunit E-like FAD-binding protein